MKADDLKEELRRFDPVKPGELDGAADTAEAAALLRRIVSTEPGAEPDARPELPRRTRVPRFALAGAAAAVAGVLAVVIGLSGGSGGGGGDQLTGALDWAAATAAAAPRASAAQPYTYLKTREMSVDTTAADARSWKVFQSTMREEWVTHDGSGRLRIVAGPSRFVGSGDRAEWEGAGEPTFLTLGFGRRTEERWLAGGMLRGRVEELPTDPTRLAARLRDEARADGGEMPVAAATLQLIAEDLRNPVASPALRRALYKAAKRVPGIGYLGERTDPEGRTGIAIGLTGTQAGQPTQYALIFDPATAEPLAFVTSSPEATAASEPPTLQRATVYVESRSVEALSEDEGKWLSDFGSSTPAEPATSDLVYRLPAGGGAS